jgi:hypothetical protein
MRNATRVSMFAVFAALLAIVAPRARADDEGGTHLLYARVAGVSQGPQGTFKRGLELGVGVERRLQSRFTLGVGVGFARDRNRFDFDEFHEQAFSLEGHGRWLIGRARVRPMLEMGLGYYWLSSHELWRVGQPPAFDQDWSAPGAWFGLGAEARLVPGVVARLGIAYHFLAQSIAVEGGNAEDYFATGLTLAYGLPGR